MTCKEPAIYLIESYADVKQSARKFVNDLDNSKHTLAKRKERSAAIKQTTNSIEIDTATDDATMNDGFNDRDMVWDRGNTGKAMEEKKRKQSNDVFKVAFPENKTNKEKFDLLEEHVISEGGSLEGTKYVTFNVWIMGNMRAKRPIKGHIIRAFESFIRHNSGMGIL